MPKNKPLKLIIDTNLWISFIISNKQNLLDSLLLSKEARLLFSKELIAEIQQTIAKPKLRKYFDTNALEEMFSTFEPFIDLIEVGSIVTVCRDVKERFGRQGDFTRKMIPLRANFAKGDGNDR